MTRKTYPHGTGNRYRTNHCRCQLCRDAHAKYMRDRRRAQAYGRWHGMQDATGTTRRIRALASIGWSFRHLAERRGLGSGTCAIRQLAGSERRKVTAEIASAYALLYDELCTSDGPSLHARTWARKRGWHGPEAWTDQTIDDPNAQPILTDQQPDPVVLRRAVAGQIEFGDLHPADRPAVFAAMRAAGLGPGAIRNRLNINKSTYYRYVNAAPQQQAVAA